MCAEEQGTITPQPPVQIALHSTLIFYLFESAQRTLKSVRQEEERIFSSSLGNYLGKRFLHADVLSTGTARILPKVSVSCFFLSLVLAARLERCFHSTEIEWPEPKMC